VSGLAHRLIRPLRQSLASALLKAPAKSAVVG